MKLTLSEHIACVEAILFASGEPVTLDALKNTLDIPLDELETVLSGLALLYDQQDRGLKLMRFAQSMQIVTQPRWLPFIESALTPVRRQSLTQAALETLAVIAYHQPITRMEVEQLRGVQCEKALATLVQHELVQEVGRKESVGRPILYGTTERFLQHFALRTLQELPQLLPVQEQNEFADFEGI